LLGNVARHVLRPGQLRGAVVAGPPPPPGLERRAAREGGLRRAPRGERGGGRSGKGAGGGAVPEAPPARPPPRDPPAARDSQRPPGSTKRAAVYSPTDVRTTTPLPRCSQLTTRSFSWKRAPRCRASSAIARTQRST